VLASASSDELEEHMIKYVDFISIPCADQKRAVAFYTEKLGLTVFTDQPFNEEQRWIELKIPGAQTKLVLFTSDEHKDTIGRSMNCSIVVDDLAACYARWSTAGVEFVSPPRTEPWGTFVVMIDSEGNKLLLKGEGRK
jgi:predicted enzyme related to lactoylglutathione lyase